MFGSRCNPSSISRRAYITRDGHSDSPFTVGFMSLLLGRCVLRAPAGPVDLDRYAPRERSRVDEVERYVRAAVGEQPRALADDHGGVLAEGPGTCESSPA